MKQTFIHQHTHIHKFITLFHLPLIKLHYLHSIPSAFLHNLTGCSSKEKKFNIRENNFLSIFNYFSTSFIFITRASFEKKTRKNRMLKRSATKIFFFHSRNFMFTSCCVVLKQRF